MEQLYRTQGELREAAIDRAGYRCEWPACSSPTDRLEMAHFRHRGIGGNPKANVLSNVAILCHYHHRGVLDGDEIVQGRRREIAEILAVAIERVYTLGPGEVCWHCGK